jgi:hypothetical protein
MLKAKAEHPKLIYTARYPIVDTVLFRNPIFDSPISPQNYWAVCISYFDSFMLKRPIRKYALEVMESLTSLQVDSDSIADPMR